MFKIFKISILLLVVLAFYTEAYKLQKRRDTEQADNSGEQVQQHDIQVANNEDSTEIASDDNQVANVIETHYSEADEHSKENESHKETNENNKETNDVNETKETKETVQDTQENNSQPKVQEIKAKSDDSHAGSHGHLKHWGYRNEDRSLLPKNWHKTHPKCYGKQQSPINVESELATYDETLSEIVISQAGPETERWNFSNNGHSVVLTPVNKEFSFVMHPENQKYKLLQMHFHWRGSEHFVDGHKFSAELHLVHQNVQNPNKFAVLGFLLKQTNTDNAALKAITDSLPQIIKYKSSTSIDWLKLDNVLPTKINHYFRYSGSLTTPACDEVVEWFLIDNPVLGISEDQLLDFQAVEDNHGYPILTNVRPVQELFERSVRRSFSELKTSAVSKSKIFVKSASGHTAEELVDSGASSSSAVFSYSFISLLLLTAFNYFY